MIVLSAPLQQEAIIELLNGFDQDGITFTFKEKKGIKLYFETNGSDSKRAAQLAKTAIKAEPWASVLYFQVEAVE